MIRVDSCAVKQTNNQFRLIDADANAPVYRCSFINLSVHLSSSSAPTANKSIQFYYDSD